MIALRSKAENFKSDDAVAAELAWQTQHVPDKCVFKPARPTFVCHFSSWAVQHDLINLRCFETLPVDLIKLIINLSVQK